jgi:hypothetical protein
METMIELTFDEWDSKYEPVLGMSNNIVYLETYGPDFALVLEQDPHYIWTWVDNGDYSGYKNGIHYVNRMGYILCDEPWQEGEEIYVDIQEITLCNMGEHIWVDHKRYDGTPVEICSECEMDRSDYDEDN